MPQETETYSAGTPFSEFVSDTMSGANTVSEHFPESPTESPPNDAAGAPPAEPSSDPRTNPTPPEGAPDTTATQPLVDGQPTAPSPTVVPESNPFEAASPLTYTVDGQSRTFDGIAYVKGVGAVIQDADVPKLQQRLQERDNLYERAQQQYEQVQALERLTTWTQKGPDNTDQTLSGAKALEEMRVTLGRNLVAMETLKSALLDPATFASLVAVDANNNLVLDQQALQHLATRSELAELNAEKQIRAHWQTIAGPQAAPTNTTLDLSQAAPVIAQHYAKEYGGGMLKDDDVTFLSGQVGRYIRPATREDVLGGGAKTIGQPVVDAAFQTVVERLAKGQQATAAAVSTASTVASENARKLQAALLPNGRAPNTTPTNPRPVTRPNSPPTSPSEEDRHALFQKMERTAFAAM